MYIIQKKNKEGKPTRTKKKLSVLAFFIEVAISPNFSSKICWAKLQSILLISKYLEKKLLKNLKSYLTKIIVVLFLQNLVGSANPSASALGKF